MKTFQRVVPTRIICDASKEGLGAVLQQKQNTEWETAHYASRFLTEFEKKCSINELELFAVVWSIENARNFVYVTEVEIISDHKALASILKRNRSNKTFSSRLTRWVDRLLQFQFTLVHAPGRTMGIADYLSRHPSENNNNIHKIKAEELWNNWFTVNEITCNKLVSENQQKHNAETQPLADHSEKNNQSHNRKDMASENGMTSESVMANTRGVTSADGLANKQTLEEIVTIVSTVQSSETDELSENNTMSEELNYAANQPPIKTPICYSVNQIEVIQTLGNYTFASQYGTDEFIQKIVTLIQKPDSTKINRLPTPWREKFRCLSLDQNKVMFMDEQLVITKALRLINIRSLHYGHPGRDTMFATVSNIWWPRLHREVVSLAKPCSQCQDSGKNLKPILTQKQFGKLTKL